MGPQCEAQAVAVGGCAGGSIHGSRQKHCGPVSRVVLPVDGIGSQGDRVFGVVPIGAVPTLGCVAGCAAVRAAQSANAFAVQQKFEPSQQTFRCSTASQYKRSKLVVHVSDARMWGPTPECAALSVKNWCGLSSILQFDIESNRSFVPIKSFTRFVDLERCAMSTPGSPWVLAHQPQTHRKRYVSTKLLTRKVVNIHTPAHAPIGVTFEGNCTACTVISCGGGMALCFCIVQGLNNNASHSRCQSPP